ncbi:DEAD/DEAH box helicase domain-containing protein [Sarocladium implicatum]|nr:DEAD/DEAH box helicase domain-containing protein [Sarocladium implicatum]
MYARYIPPAKSSAPGPRAASPPQAEPPTIPSSAPASSPAQALPQPAQVGGHGFTYSRYIPGSKSRVGPTPIAIEPADGLPDGSSPLAAKKKRKAADDLRELSPVGVKKQKEIERMVLAEDTPTTKTDSKEARKSKRKDKSKQSQEDEDATPSKKTKSKSREPANDAISKDGTDAMDVDNDEDTEDKALKKAERQRRKEKRLKEKQQPDQDGTQDEALEGQLAEAERHKSILERKSKSLKLASKATPTTEDDAMDVDPADIHDLAPLPQPEPVVIDSSQPGFETLPPWLAQPIRVDPQHKTPFGDLDVLPKAARFLEEKGFTDAFAVQTATIPLLMPTSKQQPGDVLISAATGSGKTLAYALPIVRDLSSGVVTRLRALVVLPTRELVGQAQDVFELCAKAYQGGGRKRVRIGVSYGGQLLRNEQEALIEKETRFNPDEWKRIQGEWKAKKAVELGIEPEDLDPSDMELEEPDPRLGAWQGDVVDFSSKVDVLICTPGRLVEHLEQTAGFSLDYVRWLVVDEADKLLSQSFQGWLDTVLDKFKTDLFGARDFPEMDYKGVRKVVLSATLTRDLGLLNQLALRRPKLVVLETGEETAMVEHSLPAQLKEYAVRVHETNLKPLYLLDLINGGHMGSEGKLTAAPSQRAQAEDDSDATSSDGSSTSSDSDSDSDSTSSSGSDSEAEPTPSKAPRAKSSGSHIPTSLIFTKSNESALRLSRLLTILSPALTSHIATITSTTPTSHRRKLLRSFASPSSPLRLIVASDLVARGIDIRSLDHVVNYDLPASVAGYVHRVGRTARAGRGGSAWTLVADEESGWFWGKIAKAKGIERAQKVERVRIEEMGEESVKEYEDALEKLGREAVEKRR